MKDITNKLQIKLQKIQIQNKKQKNWDVQWCPTMACYSWRPSAMANGDPAPPRIEHEIKTN